MGRRRWIELPLESRGATELRGATEQRGARSQAARCFGVSAARELPFAVRAEARTLWKGGFPSRWARRVRYRIPVSYFKTGRRSRIM